MASIISREFPCDIASFNISLPKSRLACAAVVMTEMASLSVFVAAVAYGAAVLGIIGMSHLLG
ncbi:MAG: hypothetical protein HQL34_11840 [Alphaproteobacteria bacterium]|nr:hypothetical protein [Alphaproteobacteria bacterium]